MSSMILLGLLSTASALASCRLPAPGCQLACNQLASKFGTLVHFPSNDNDFEVWDAKQQQTQYACRVTPTISADVAEIVSVLTENWCRFAVKGGGHARNADDSVSDGGVTIDLVNMKSVKIAADRSSVELGGGHVLYSLYTALEPYNLSTVGGRVATVGLGGFALGGGLSNFSPQYGLAVDNVLEYEIVLANATVITVDHLSHPELYFALRGGMNNFGIVTRFTLRTFPQGKLYSGSVTFSAEHRDAVAEQAYELTTTWKNDTNMAFSYGYAYSQDTGRFTLSVTQAYAKPILDPLPFKTLNRIPHVSSTLRIDWMSNFALEGASARPPGGRNLYATLSYYPAKTLDKQLQDIFAEEIFSVKNITGLSPNLIFQPIFEAVIREGRVRGGSALGIDADGPLTSMLLTFQWSDGKDDSIVYAFVERFIARAKAATVAARMDHKWMYINYANQQQDPFEGYGAANLKRLIETQKSVDARGVFASRGLCRGYFKLR